MFHPPQAAEIQSKASDAATKLSTLSSNATLVSSCAVIEAAEETEYKCREMKQLMRFISMASNKTLVAEKTENNATKSMSFRLALKCDSVELKRELLAIREHALKLLLTNADTAFYSGRDSIKIIQSFQNSW